MNAQIKITAATTLPRFIAICGNPKSGKTEVQNILQEVYGVTPVDDGRVIRRFAIDYLGLTEDDVYTQAGKAGFVDILGKNWQVRDILGSYGNQLEAMFGKHVMPMLGTRTLPEGGNYSFGSVRRDQGLFYQKAGGIVIWVKDATVGPSPYEFDSFDTSIVDFVLNNDSRSLGLSREVGLARLRDQVLALVTDVIRHQEARAAA